MFKEIINHFRLKIYDGRVLVPGTYATIFGNPIEYLKYIIKKNDKPLFDESNISSTLKEGEICCSFFKNNEEIVGSRAPHLTMGNLLYVKNKTIPEINTWFNLTRNIVVVDAINNNIQQRLNGMDYDSDIVLLTNKPVIVEATKENYDKFLVPVVAFDHNDKPLEDLSKNKKENLLLNLCEMDNKISNNKVGEIVNLAQKYNSHLWDRLNKDDDFDYDELYNTICILSVLAGAEIDSSKRNFPFNTASELAKARKYGKDHGYEKKPAFFNYVSSGQKEKPKINEIDNIVANLKEEDYLQTSMDFFWKEYAYSKITAPDTKTTAFKEFILNDIDTKDLSGENYNQVERALQALIDTRDILNNEKRARNKVSYDVNKKDFDAEVLRCYNSIKTGIKDKKRVILLINLINKESTPQFLLFLLLYIISSKEKELNYGYKDLFKADGGVPALERTDKKNTKFELFNVYHYERSLYSKVISSISSFDEK